MSLSVLYKLAVCFVYSQPLIPEAAVTSHFTGP